MEVMNLVLAILGHVMASVLYIIRKFRSPPKKAIVDRSSILQRKEELKKLWERKMAEAQQKVVATEETTTAEEIKKDVHSNGSIKMTNGNVITEHQSHSKNENSLVDLKNSEKQQNGSAMLIDIDENSNIEKPQQNNSEKKKQLSTSANLLDMDENSNIERSELDISQVCEIANEVVEATVAEATEKIYTSTLQQTLIINKTTESSVTKEDEITKELSSPVETTPPVTQASTENIEDQEDFEEIERRIQAEESMAQGDQDLLTTEEIEVESTDGKLDLPEELGSNAALGDERGEHTLSSNADSLETLDQHGDEEEDFVCVGDAIFAGDLNSGSKDSVAMNGYTPSPDAGVENGEQEEKTFDDHFVLDTRELESPSSDKVNEKPGRKSSRFKTEQPYNTCTTETKIAMEIREMREREEELKLMRERQAQMSPQPKPQQQQQPVQKSTPHAHKFTTIPKTKQITPPYVQSSIDKIPTTPGYRVSSVFGHRPASQVPKDDNKNKFNKESPVEREIRLAKDREEELRKQKGLPPREDDSFVKPSEVKSAQAKVFGKILNSENSRLMATAKIQHEIEEQTMRELALRESGSIQTLSSERTDSRVTKLNMPPECVSPTFMNGNSTLYTNGSYTNGHISPDVLSKRSTPSPTGSNSSYSIASRSSPMMGVSGMNKGISMQKFIASRGKDTTFSAPRNGPFLPKSDYYHQQETVPAARGIPEPGKLKRTLSVESKIQQEILEMKLREEELKLLHSGQSEIITENGNKFNGNGICAPRSPIEYQNGQTETEELNPRKSNLIAQWEQRIQNAA